MKNPDKPYEYDRHGQPIEPEPWYWKYIAIVIIIIFFGLIVLLSRCSQPTCPAYARYEREQLGPAPGVRQQKQQNLFWYKLTPLK